jgi:hypothetical protein
MNRTSKQNIPWDDAIMSLHNILHPSILSTSNKKQLRKEDLQRNFPTPNIMPKQNFRTIPDLISHMRSKIIPSPPNAFPHAKPIRTPNLLRTPTTPQTTIFDLHHLSPKSISLHRSFEAKEYQKFWGSGEDTRGD